MSGDSSDSKEFMIMDSDMVHAFSCMMSAHADLIQSMVVANKGLEKEGGPAEPVFDAERIRKVADSAMRFVPAVKQESAEEGPAGPEEDSVVLPFRKPGGGDSEK